MIKPDFSNFSVNTILAALGQMFYSMSLAMGIMVTYGSYLKKDVDMEKSVKQIEWFDTGVAVLAALMVVPAGLCLFRRRQQPAERRPRTDVYYPNRDKEQAMR